MSSLSAGFIAGFVVGILASYAFSYDRAVDIYRDRAIERAVEQADKDRRGEFGGLILPLLILAVIIVLNDSDRADRPDHQGSIAAVRWPGVSVNGRWKRIAESVVSWHAGRAFALR